MPLSNDKQAVAEVGKEKFNVFMLSSFLSIKNTRYSVYKVNHSALND